MNSLDDEDETIYLYRWIVAIAACAGSVMATMDTFILFVSGPYLRGVFSASVSEISWLTTSYATASLVMMLLSGYVSRALGNKSAFMLALCTFLTGSLLCASANELHTLVMARIVQGAGAGVMLPVEIVILRSIFPSRMHPLIMGLYGTTVMAGPALGPVFGGMIIDNFHWSIIFLINIPIGLLSLGLIYIYLQSERPESSASFSKIDWIGIGSLVLGMFTLILLLERGDRTYWFDDSDNRLLLYISAFSLAFLVAHELTVKSPAIDFSVLRYPVLAPASFLIFTLGFVVSSTLFLLPIYMQEQLDFSPTYAGMAMAPRAIVMALIFPFSGLILNWVKPKHVILTGLTMGLIASTMMSLFTHDTGWGDTVLPQIILGIGIALVLTPLNTVALMYVPKSKLGAASAFEATCNQLGATLGITISATMLSYLEKANWGLLRHNVSLSHTVLYKRFSGVIEYFHDTTASRFESMEKAFRALNGRVTEQILSLSFMYMFQLVAVAFAIMIVVSILTRLTPPLLQNKPQR